MREHISREDALELLKKYKSANFAAGCFREVIQKGADMLGYDLSELIEKTILAMRSCEQDIIKTMEE